MAAMWDRDAAAGQVSSERTAELRAGSLNHDIVAYDVRYVGGLNWGSTCGSASFYGDLCAGEWKAPCSGTIQCGL